MTEYADLLLISLVGARKLAIYRERMNVNVREERRIVVDLVQVEKDSNRPGQLRVVESPSLKP